MANGDQNLQVDTDFDSSVRIAVVRLERGRGFETRLRLIDFSNAVFSFENYALMNAV